MDAIGKPVCRYGYVDASKGLAIVGVYCGHHALTTDFMTDWFWSFHMPLFFFVTGLFSNKLRTQSICDIIKSGLQKLVLPFVLTELILTVTLLVMIHQTEILVSPVDFLCYMYDNAIVRNHPIWFLLALFYGRCFIVFCHLNVYSLNKYQDTLGLIIVLILFCIGWITGNNLMNTGHTDYGCICKGLLAPIYIYAGLKLQYLFQHSTTYSMYFLLCSVIVLLSAGNVSFNMYYFDYPLGIFNVLTSLVVCIALLYVLMTLCNINNKVVIYITSFLSFIGRNTLYILCAHTLELILKVHRFIPVDSDKLSHIIVFVFILFSIPIIKKVPVIGTIYQIRK